MTEKINKEDSLNFSNSWGTKSMADAYSKLEFPNTYYLAYRDLPEIIARHVKGNKAVDFGCGAGRTTRFLQRLGFEVTGIDVSIDMINKAKEADPAGKYELVEDCRYFHIGLNKYDLVQSIFTFDNIPGWENRAAILMALSDLLNKTGKMILLDASPELYVNEWTSFTTECFPENKNAKTGSIVKDIVLDIEDKTPIEDIYWTEEDYIKLFVIAGLKVEAVYKPLGRSDEPFEWKSEKEINPWIIFVLTKSN